MCINLCRLWNFQFLKISNRIFIDFIYVIFLIINPWFICAVRTAPHPKRIRKRYAMCTFPFPYLPLYKRLLRLLRLYTNTTTIFHIEEGERSLIQSRLQSANQSTQLQVIHLEELYFLSFKRFNTFFSIEQNFLPLAAIVLYPIFVPGLNFTYGIIILR